MNSFLEFRRQYKHAIECIDNRDFQGFLKLTDLDIIRVLKRYEYTPLHNVKSMLKSLYRKKKVGAYENFRDDSITYDVVPDFSSFWSSGK